MADPDTPDERLAELRRRWEANPTARAGLHLAEEYRRIGGLEQALEVLTAGLKENPDHLAAQVALGKTRLEMGDAATAAEVFSAVVDKDPTHIVANRLLIEAHLRRGEAAAARQRLEHYRLLGADGDELEELESRVAATSPPPPAPPAAPAEAPAADGLDQARPETAEPAVAPTVRRPQNEPFTALLGTVDLGRHLESLGGAGLFPVALPPPAPEPEPEPAAEAPVAEARAASEVQPAAEPETVAEPEPAPEPETAAEPEAVAAAPAPEAAPGPQPDSAGVEEPPAAAAAAAAEETAPAGPLPAAADDERRATVTLGNLYLSQRHYAEAERIFRQVLERRPGDEAAERGLAEAQRHQTRMPTAEELVRWAEREGKLPPAEAGQERRTAALLRAYVDRLREREAGGVS